MRLPEGGRLNGHTVTYIRGKVDEVLGQLPSFELRPFKLPDSGLVNSSMKVVARKADDNGSEAIPVGLVSNSYSLAQHSEVFELCLRGMKSVGVKSEELDVECGLTEYGEWMNLRMYFPERFNHVPSDKNSLRLRLECFNSVDGSAKLKVFLGWYRFICSNGMIVGETLADFRDTHDSRLELSGIPKVIRSGLTKVKKDKAKLSKLEKTKLIHTVLVSWVDSILAPKWGKKAASRVYSICEKGRDSRWLDPFVKGEASQRAVKLLGTIPGSPERAANCYDVLQALTWVSTRVENVATREKMNEEAALLVGKLRSMLSRSATSVGCN